MGWLDTLRNWATSAWHSITGLGGDFEDALTKLWNFVNSSNSVLSWVLFGGVKLAIKSVAADRQILARLFGALSDAQQRQPVWIVINLINPVKTLLIGMIGSLRKWTAYELAILWLHTIDLFLASEAYTRQLVSAERTARIKAVAAEHAAMLATVRAAMATINTWAASGYNAGLDDRKSTLQKLLASIAERTPAVAGLVADLAGLIADIESIDNPVIRWLARHVLSAIVGHLGIDQAAGDLVAALLGPLTGQPRPRGLYDVARDVSARLNALEGWQAGFMADGGPQIEQAGREWKDLTGLLVDAGAVALFALAVNDPAAWARGVNDTIGTVAGDAVTGIVDLIRSA